MNILSASKKTRRSRLVAGLLICLGSAFTASTLSANGQSRAEYINLSSADTVTQQKNPGVSAFGGSLRPPSTPPPSGPETVLLQESSYGQAFSQWFPSDTYGRDILEEVNSALYPNLSTTTGLRQSITDSGAAFRYKWLMYEGSGVDVTAFDTDTTAIDQWFNDDDRQTIAEQIEVLKKAVAASPFDTSLRNALLDIYYDLAVAEMQATKPLLANLAKFRLGIELLQPDEFIIDKEIETYEQIAEAILQSIQHYTELMTDPFPGIVPSSFDPDIRYSKMPMGRYIFLREQPRRNSAPTQFANDSAIQEVPKLDSQNNPIPRPPGEDLFTGYKDLNTLLQIIGSRQQHLASLARLRGARRAPGDLAKARQSISDIAGPEATQLQIIKNWFPELFPPDPSLLSQSERDAVDLKLEKSGILASLTAIDLARIDLSSVTPLLNGSANILGYDPDFLLLVQPPNPAPGETPLDSYDMLRNMLKGDNKPLTDALNKLGTRDPRTGAAGTYLNFQEKVDIVAEDIFQADTALKQRFWEITGYQPDASPGFDFNNPNPTDGSELGGALATIQEFNDRAEARKGLNAEFNAQLSDSATGAKAAVATAEKKEEALLAAAQTYKDQTASFYDEMIAASIGAAGAQAAYDTISDVASIAADASLFKAANAGAAIGVTAAAGALNIVAQTTAANTIGRKEQAIDYAAIDFAVTTESVDASLVVNQARMDLSALKREQISSNIEHISDISALTGAVAQRDTLMAELARIILKRNNRVSEIRSRSYADPLHYYRAESALIDADAAFRRAQTWMFYTLQALNYKWNDKFAMSPGSKSYDSSTLFKCRNAAELDELLTQMEAWNDDRVTQTTNSPRRMSVISLRDDILAINPNRHNENNPEDPGTRPDNTIKPPTQPLPTLTKLEYFRKLLRTKYLVSNRVIEIPFETVFRNEDRIDPNFFRGATYDDNGLVSPGNWREKIEYVKVNIIADDAPDDLPESLNGVLTYGGNMYFRTRVPPPTLERLRDPKTNDAPGELLVTPFLDWVSPNFNGNFAPRSERTIDISVAYSKSTAIIQSPDGIQDNLGLNYQIPGLFGRSIAATGWKLRVELQTSNFFPDLDQIQDIEIIIYYKNSQRERP